MAVSYIKKAPAIANNLTTTDAGSVLDARQGKALSDQFANLKQNVFVMTTQTFSDKAGNSDLHEVLTLPTGWTQSDVAFVLYMGSFPSTTWDTMFIPKQIDNYNGQRALFFHTKGSTKQNYTVYLCFIKKWF